MEVISLLLCFGYHCSRPAMLKQRGSAAGREAGWVNMERGNKTGVLINRLNHLIGRRNRLNFLDNTAARILGEMSGRMTQNYFYNILSICILMTAKESKIKLQTTTIRWHVWTLLLLVYLRGLPFTSLICGKRACEHMLASSQRAGAAWGSVWCHSTCRYCTAAERQSETSAFPLTGQFLLVEFASHNLCDFSRAESSSTVWLCNEILL